MVTALLEGTNIKRDGSIRQWDCAEYHGHHKKSDGGTLLQVIENKQIRLINLNTFSGVILDHDYEFEFVNGVKVSKQAYNLPF